MSILVIGGNGFLGRRLLYNLLQDGKTSNVVCMDVNPPKESFMKAIQAYSSKFRYVRGDLTQLEDILNAVKSFSIEKIVNLGYLMVFETEQMPRLAAKINVLGMCNVFEAARLMGVERVIYASSHGVYGSQGYYGDREITEDDFVVPKFIYGIMKQLNEKIAGVYSEQYGLKTLCFRPCHVFGPGREAARVARLFTDLISLPAVGKPFSIDFAPRPYIWTYVDDVTRFIRILLDVRSPKHNIYNIGGWTATSAEVADIIRQYLPDAKIEFGNQPADLGSPTKISNARAREDLGFNLTPLKDSVLSHINEARAEAGLPPIKTS